MVTISDLEWAASLDQPRQGGPLWLSDVPGVVSCLAAALRTKLPSLRLTINAEDPRGKRWAVIADDIDVDHPLVIPLQATEYLLYVNGSPLVIANDLAPIRLYKRLAKLISEHFGTY